MRDLNHALSELGEYVAYAEKENESVSTVNIGWHIEHSLLVIVGMIDSLGRSDPDNYRWRFNRLRTVLFTSKRFPRGKGKAPDAVKPRQTEMTDYNTLFEKARQALERLRSAQPRQYFRHALFGDLDRKNSTTILEIHTRHHLMIIKDILK